MRTIWRSAAAAFITAASVFLSPGFAATEQQQAAVAPLYGRNYAVLAPVFTGADGNLSFVRLANDNATASTFIVTVVGSPSGKVYGSVNLRVPAPNIRIAMNIVTLPPGTTITASGETSTP